MNIHACTYKLIQTFFSPFPNARAHRIAAKTAAFLSNQMLGFRWPHSLANFFESIEHSTSKGDFKVGLEAR